MNDDALKPPSHSIEAEQSVIGGLLLDNDGWDKVADVVAEQDFYAGEHRRIFRAIGRLIETGKAADVITVAEFLEKHGMLADMGGLPYLGTLAQNTPSAANIRRYAEIVHERAVVRRVDMAAMDIRDKVYSHSGMSAAELVDFAQAKMQAVSEQASKGSAGPQRIIDVMGGVIEKIESLHARDDQNEVTGLATGFAQLDKMTTGLQPGDLVVLAARPSMGKAQPVDSKVLTANGWSLMSDLRVGNYLASVDGGKSIVTGIYPQGKKQVFRITFSDGRSAECCNDHLWNVYHRKWAEPKVLSTADIRELLENPHMHLRLWIDYVNGEFGKKGDYPVDPWLLGALLGDGDLTQKTIRFSKNNEQTLCRIRNSLPAPVRLVHAGGCDWRLSEPRAFCGEKDANPLTAGMRNLNLMGCKSVDKFIPEIYINADKDTRLSVLRGLMDTDGWVEKHGSVLLSSASKELSKGVQILARSLGYWCSMREKNTGYRKNGEYRQCEKAYVVTISGNNLDDLFLCEQKKERCSDRSRVKHVAFAKIEFIRDADCQCISVSHPSQLYITNDYVVTHNTALALNIAEHVGVNLAKPVVVFSIEMLNEQLGLRLMASMSKIHAQRVRTGRIYDNEWDRITGALKRVHDAPIWLDEDASITPTELRTRARRIHRECGGLSLIVIDYLQLMRLGGGGDNNRAQELGDITRGLKHLAKELHCPVIVLSQLNRGLESRPDKRPIMSDLKDSGSIEQDADIVFFVYRDEVYNSESPDKGLAEIIVGKQRNGPTGRVVVNFDGALTRFSDRDHHAPLPSASMREQNRARRAGNFRAKNGDSDGVEM